MLKRKEKNNHLKVDFEKRIINYADRKAYDCLFGICFVVRTYNIKCSLKFMRKASDVLGYAKKGSLAFLIPIFLNNSS
jgi:hypothetical protein